jgi:hypothetical protein
MIEILKLLLKTLADERGRVAIQLGTFTILLVGAFYFGFQTKDFVAAQIDATNAMNKLNATVSKLEEDRWTYTMQKEYHSALQGNNKELKVPDIREIREKHIIAN